MISTPYRSPVVVTSNFFRWGDCDSLPRPGGCYWGRPWCGDDGHSAIFTAHCMVVIAMVFGGVLILSGWKRISGKTVRWSGRNMDLHYSSWSGMQHTAFCLEMNDAQNGQRYLCPPVANIAMHSPHSSIQVLYKWWFSMAMFFYQRVLLKHTW